MKTPVIKPCLLMMSAIFLLFIVPSGCGDDKGPSMQTDVDENNYFAPVENTQRSNRSKRTYNNSESFAKRRADMLIRNLDKDQDQMISARELEGHRFAEQIGMSDADGNGMITRQELTDLRKMRSVRKSGTKDKSAPDREQINKYFSKYDTDKNGSITPDEAEKSRFGSGMMRADTDGDKKISQEEFDKAARDYYSRMRRGPGQGRSRGGQQGRPRRGQGRGYRRTNQNMP